MREWLTFAAVGVAGVTLSLVSASAQDERLARASDRLPGGAATSTGNINDQDAFSHASGNLGFVKRFEFRIGNALFRKLWTPAQATPDRSGGLGPLFNARSCQQCHQKDGRGHPEPQTTGLLGDNTVSMLLKLSIPPQTVAHHKALASGKTTAISEPTYGLQLQNKAIEGQTPEGRLRITYRAQPFQLADGEVINLRAPTYRIAEPGYGPLPPELMTSPRIAPPMIGLGLLDAIPAKDILARADPDDRNGDGISGRANKVWSLAGDKPVLGRFGWKATVPSVAEQTALAFSTDMGLSTARFPAPFGDCTQTQSRCRTTRHGSASGKAEVSDAYLRLLVFYSQNVAVPPRRNGDAADVRNGNALFLQVGCAACHTPSHRTGSYPGSPNLEAQTIWPYTDLLLHDMGDGLADHRPEAQATGREWRTPPLWGIGLTETVSGHTFLLHDGRARNVIEAILWHNGEARRSRDAFARLSKTERSQLVAFVNSL